MSWLKRGLRGQDPTIQFSLVTARLAVTCPSPINLRNGSLIVHSRPCVGHEMVQPGGRYFVRRTWESMQINVSKGVTRVIKRSAGIRSD